MIELQLNRAYLVVTVTIASMENTICYYAHAADFCYKLLDRVSMEEGSLLEPLSVGIYACRRANVNLGTRILIPGAGPIGLSVLIAAKSMGAGDIIITDIVNNRLELAKELGATHTLT